jgi:hypothetical protein
MRKRRTGSEDEEQDHIAEEQDTMIIQVAKQSDKAGEGYTKVRKQERQTSYCFRGERETGNEKPDMKLIKKNNWE